MMTVILLKAAINLVKPTMVKTLMEKSLSLPSSVLPIVIPEIIPIRMIKISVSDQTPSSIRCRTIGLDSAMFGSEVP